MNITGRASSVFRRDARSGTLASSTPLPGSPVAQRGARRFCIAWSAQSVEAPGPLGVMHFPSASLIGCSNGPFPQRGITSSTH
jgi:hypothetical protein